MTKIGPVVLEECDDGHKLKNKGLEIADYKYFKSQGWMKWDDGWILKPSAISYLKEKYQHENEQYDSDKDDRNIECTATLYDFQRENLNKLKQQGGKLLVADSMGLGKTITTISFVADQKKTPALIICPRSLKYNWQNEIEKFITIDDKSAKVQVLNNGEEIDNNVDFVIVNYDKVRNESTMQKLIDFKKRIVILDECHKVKNYKAKQTQAVNKICETVNCVVGLSGTPILNHGVEIYNVMKPINPKIFGSNPWPFFNEFTIKRKFDRILNPKKYEQLQERMQQGFIRHRKDDVLQQLPEKKVIPYAIDFDYKEYKKKFSDELEAIKDKEDKRGATLQAITAERQLVGKYKVDAATEFVKNILEQGEPVLLFAHHREVISELADNLKEHNPKMIVGGQNEEERDEAVQAFQNGDTRLLIGSITTAGVGLNLTAARYAVFAELDWTPANHWQAEDRIHRIGQNSNVTIYYLVAVGSLDDMIVELTTSKIKEFNNIIEKKGAENITLMDHPALKDRLGSEN